MLPEAQKRAEEILRFLAVPGLVIQNEDELWAAIAYVESLNG